MTSSGVSLWDCVTGESAAENEFPVCVLGAIALE
jgi:hypothetical protein